MSAVAGILLLLLIGFGGCLLWIGGSALPPSAFGNGAPRMLPEAFFSGETVSTGVLENRAGAPTQRFEVKGSGRMLADGRFCLDQTVTYGKGAPEQRRWVIRRLGAHRYTATLTGASGPVTAQAYGNLFHLQYPMKKPFGGRMEQWLYLQPDGRTVVNEATVRVFGVVVARVSERITHEQP